MRRIFQYLLIAAVGVSNAVVQAGTPQENAATIRRRLEQLTAKGEFRGQVLLERDGEVLISDCFGDADLLADPHTAASESTLYYIGSLAKMFTSAVVLQLVGEGKLSLEGSIGAYLPNVPEDKQQISVTDLLTHSSGLPANYADPLAKLDQEQFLAWTLQAPLEFRPGEKQSYSNVGFSLLAVIVERAGNEEFTAAVRRRVFERAGMTNTYFLDDPALDRTRMARGAGGKLAEFKVNRDPVDYGRTWLRMGSGGIVSSAGDLLRWEQALRRQKVLSREQYAQATGPSKPSPAWGFGWRLSKSTRGTPIHFHDGGFPGFSAGFARFPAENAVVILLCNGDDLAGPNGRWIVSEFFK